MGPSEHTTPAPKLKALELREMLIFEKNRQTMRNRVLCGQSIPAMCRTSIVGFNYIRSGPRSFDKKLLGVKTTERPFVLWPHHKKGFGIFLSSCSPKW